VFCGETSWALSCEDGITSFAGATAADEGSRDDQDVKASQGDLLSSTSLEQGSMDKLLLAVGISVAEMAAEVDEKPGMGLEVGR
jgi:hypothetical protein